jgi:hypothetical protein
VKFSVFSFWKKILYRFENSEKKIIKLPEIRKISSLDVFFSLSIFWQTCVYICIQNQKKKKMKLFVIFIKIDYCLFFNSIVPGDHIYFSKPKTNKTFFFVRVFRLIFFCSLCYCGIYHVRFFFSLYFGVFLVCEK